ncbi:hypothetical protein CCR75_005522 [Bremia lactucae]|uniref:Uncharacterized protein n=1 Tax=Bremia lactucae TaxID=4779 RepID=A0A976IBZ3_BRELC|nr:hypothetical protein CCR75_005522 [Bremia lactucae]
MVSPYLTVFAAKVAMLTAMTKAHSYVVEPAPTWPENFPITEYSGSIDGQKYLPVPTKMSYGTSPEGNTEAYWKAFNASTYTSLKDLADKTMVLRSLDRFGTASPECGFSVANGTERDLPAKVVWKDFGISHQGPCEVWCDDKLAFTDSNCAVNYPEVPALLPYDVNVCIGAKMMQSYWIALHGLPWQLYVNCVPLTGQVSSTANIVTDETNPEQMPTTLTTPSRKGADNTTGAFKMTTSITADSEDPNLEGVANDSETDTSNADVYTFDTIEKSATPILSNNNNVSEIGKDPTSGTTDMPKVSDVDFYGAVNPKVTPAIPSVAPAAPTITQPSTRQELSGGKCSRRRY